MKPQVCFVHGFLGDRHDWDPVVDRVAESLRCTVVELPGHASVADETEIQADTLEHAADELARRAHGMALVGYSMGGRLSLLAATRSPAAFSHLMLISAHPGIDSPQARRVRAAADDALAARLASMDEAGFRAFLTEWYAAPLFGDLARHQDFEQTRQRRLRHSPAAVAAGLRTLSVGRQPPLWHALTQLQPPCRFLAGRRDVAYCALASRIQTNAARIDVHLVPSAAHAVHREDPQSVADHLVALIAS